MVGRPAQRAALLVAVLALVGCSGDPGADEAPVTWGESPACVSYPDVGRVGVTLEATGGIGSRVTVTAYADEDTTEPVGSGVTTVTETGTVEMVFDVSAPPFVDADGEAACTLDVQS